ncbi:MAG TPA: hypothetical protein VGC54_11935 [Planctomycetota bacterium]
MKRCTLDKIASVTLRLDLDRNAVLGAEIPALAGSVVAGRVLDAKSVYNQLEDVHGRMVTLHPGDVIAGALGHRDALLGYSGHVPESVAPGDILQLLNLGGVLGVGARPAPGIGAPIRVEVLGAVLEFPFLGRRVGRPASVARAGLPATDPVGELPPVVALVGTSMHAGKTTAAAVIVGELVRRGLRVAAGKLTGVSLRRDVLEMQDCGADPVALFTDFGVVTTDADNAAPAARALLAHLADAAPDVIVLEMGDGLLGTYGVHAVLEDPVLRAAIRASVLCAQDPVGAWGGCRLLEENYGLVPDALSGRVTDNPAGSKFCSERLKLPAWNALREGPELAQAMLESLDLQAVKA